MCSSYVILYKLNTAALATLRQQVQSEVWVPSVGRQVAGPSVSASSSPIRRCRWDGQSSAREELEEGELDVYRRGQDGPADGNTAPVRPVGPVSAIGTGSGTSWFGLSGASLGSGIGPVEQLLQRSLARTTWSAYAACWRQWEEWVRELGDVNTDRDRLVALLYWLGDAWEAGFSVAKVNRFISAVAFGFKLRGFQDVSKEFLVSQALKGLRRGRVEADSRRPVSFALLSSLGGSLASVCRSSDEMDLFRLAFSLAFFGAFRIGELVSPSTKQAGGLRSGEVSLFADRLEVWLRRSKTDQVGKGKLIVLFALPGSVMCPVECMRGFTPNRGSPDLPLLRHVDGSFLSRFQFGAVFKKCLTAVGVAAGSYSSHSFRIGAATEAGRWGLDDEGVRRIGRWESNRFKSYVRPHML
ncbi:uncharacterized protein LOC142656971 [Rhinoderma darwinii]|uniref:uncharacterized protein LOC142656971 n=1 Tax=Rhinoderma darwinii TaxID=43563 RepID=UPI003F67AB56